MTMFESRVDTFDPFQEHYAHNLYRIADPTYDDGKDKTETLLLSNIVLGILFEGVINRLEKEVPGLAGQIKSGRIDELTKAKVEKIFSDLGFNPSKGTGPQLTSVHQDLARRVANVLRSQTYNMHSALLAGFLFCTKKFSQDEAFRAILACQTSGSLCDAIAKKARLVLHALTCQEQTELAEAKAELQRNRQILEESRAREEKSRLMLQEIKSWTPEFRHQVASEFIRRFLPNP
jgi:hypothetical protein